MAIPRLVRALAIASAMALLASCGGDGGSGGGSSGDSGATGVSIGGTVSGLIGTVVLQNNGSDSLSISANGSFTFPTAIANGSAFNVAILIQPAGQVCSVANGAGTASGANVTNVSVTCAANGYTVGGTVSGLSGTVVLQLNGGSPLQLSADGAFSIPSTVVDRSAYSVTVFTHPVGQTCTVTNGAGTVSGANVTNVAVTCATNTFSLGGAVSGLAGTLVLRVNGGNDLTLTTNGPFAFSGQLADGSTYSVTVLTQPAGQSCSIADGTGTIAGANVASVSVSCAVNTFTVGGTVSGLSGSLVLQNNAANNLTIAVNGPFSFPTALPNGNAYSVTVLTQPAGQTCTVTNGAGTVSGANVSNVSVICAADTHTVGGAVSGLSGTGLVLQNNAANNLAVAANGSFSFPTALQNGSPYNVTVLTQPAGQTCTVANGAGTVSGANVSNVAVTCATNTFSLGGAVSGLAGTLVLRVNGGNDLTVTTDGLFAFSGPLADGTPYSVTVLTQPAGQSCSIADGTGTIAGANVANVSVSCAVNTFTVGGTVSGLSGTVVLQLNGGSPLALSANGAFSFPSTVINTTPYSVTVFTHPVGQTCTVTNASGSVSGANVTNVAVTCATNTFSLGGAVSGLTGTLILRVDGGNDLTVTTNGPFTFSAQLVDRSAYSVTVFTHPVGQTCTVTNGAGTVSGANVTNVAVTCATNTFSLGGAVSGLAGTLVLRVNGGNDLTLTTNGPFAFSGQLADGSTYSVTVLTQPAGQSCSIADGTGTIAGANVASVSVSCAVNTFTVGGTVSGLSGSLVLQNNAANNLTIAVNGPFSFPTALPNGNAYSVTVLTQPAGQTCTVTNGAGTVSGANVSNVSVICAADTHTVGGAVSGLSGTGLVLQNNAANNLAVAANGSFSFPTALQNGSPYNVTVLTQPAGQTCTVANGAGTVSGANVSNVAVTCATNTFSLGGAVSGLAGTLVLRVNGGNDLTVTTDGLFAFSGPLADGTPYSVTVLTQPAGQSCSIADGTGTIAGANVANVSVSCAVNTFTVGGTVSGLSGTVVLQLNGGSPLALSANGAFSFPSTVINTTPYSVTVFTHPVGQTCTVTNASGSVSGANVTNVAVTCATNTFSLGGTVSGLTGTLILRVDGGNDLTVTTNGPFTFSAQLVDRSAYSVTVFTHPVGQTCTVTNGAGTVSGANVTNVAVTCATNSFAIGGTVSGLSGSLVLQNNGGNDLTIAPMVRSPSPPRFRTATPTASRF